MATKSKFNPLLSTGLQDVYDENSPVVYQVEDFISATNGNIIQIFNTSVNGGSVASEIWESQPNYNGSIAKPRKGQSSIRINTLAGSRSGSVTGSQYQFSNNDKFAFSAEFSIVGGQINFATDRVFQWIGYLSNVSVVPAFPPSGVFVRPPLFGETNNMKIVIRVAGIDTIFNTTLNYDAASRRFCKVYIEWDGPANKFIFKLYDDTVVFTQEITNISVVYPGLISIVHSFGFLNARDTAIVSIPIARNINVDKIERWHLAKNFKD